MKRVLITGAGGQIGRVLRQGLRGKYHLRLLDRTPITGLEASEEFVKSDLSDVKVLQEAMANIDGIVHLAAVSVEDAWEKILPSNIIGTLNLFEAACRAGAKRVLFASSNHAVGFYRRDQVIGTDVTVRPDSRYGVSKAFGEALCSLYADKYGLETYCMRIGNVAERPVDMRRLAIWISPRDLIQLVEIGLEHPDINFEIVYGMSGNDRAWWDNSHAERLGYRPLDNSETYADEVIAAEPQHDPNDLQHIYQGGTFVNLEYGGGSLKEAMRGWIAHPVRAFAKGKWGTWRPRGSPPR
ncbi:MAG: NAD(P)-dependent oxidoreductase [Verrucomicrobia bacterium]|nr:NAD(P)-dependent oxidoreductase [Verrucomicrobiota bacterium]